jgi:hypothetical protein
VVKSPLEKKAETDGEEKFTYYVVRKDTEKGGIDVIPIVEFEEINLLIHDDTLKVLGVKEYPMLMNLYDAKQYIWNKFDSGEYTE